MSCGGKYRSDISPLMWQVSVGRLGIITQLTIKMVPQQAVQRAEQDMSASKFADQVKQVQDAYLQAKQTGSASAIWTALHSLNETQVLLPSTCASYLPLIYSHVYSVSPSCIKVCPYDQHASCCPNAVKAIILSTNIATKLYW